VCATHMHVADVSDNPILMAEAEVLPCFACIIP